MGGISHNAEVVSHQNVGGQVNDYKMRVHQGTPPVDSFSPGYDQDSHEELKTKSAGPFPGFDQAVGDISTQMAAWWSAWPQGTREAFYRNYSDL